MNNQKIDEDRFISGLFWGVLMGGVTAMLTLPKTLKQLRRERKLGGAEKPAPSTIAPLQAAPRDPLVENALDGQRVARQRRTEFGIYSAR